MRKSIKLISAMLMILSLSACGLKGPLYKPSEKATALSSFQLYDLDKTA